MKKEVKGASTTMNKKGVKVKASSTRRTWAFGDSTTVIVMTGGVLLLLVLLVVAPAGDPQVIIITSFSMMVFLQ